MNHTKRPTMPALETILGQEFQVLDHGFVRLIDYMGDDEAIVQAARVSYGTGTKTTQSDRGLIRYLMRHRHTTPLEMCEIKFHVKLPIFVARQWIRHRMASVNEYSARYSILDREFYLPEPQHIAHQSAENKQGRGEPVTLEHAQRVIDVLREDASRNYEHYEGMLSDGVSRELARMNLPVNYYTQWYWKVDLHNLLHFLSLRMDAHAQYEIRAYADVIGGIVSKWVPHAWEAFRDYRMDGVHLSRMEWEAVRALLRGEQPDTSEMSDREKREFFEKIG